MHHLIRRGTLVSACVVALVLALSSVALADALRYQVPPGNGYTVDNTEGIAKVTIDQCVAAGTPITLPLTIATSGSSSKGGPASFKVMKAAGGSISFSPSSTTVAAGQTASFSFTIVPNGTGIGAKGAFFRFKLIPQSGSGAGQGPGVMVRVPCVLEPAPTPQNATAACTSAGDTPVGKSDNGKGNGGVPGQGKGRQSRTAIASLRSGSAAKGGKGNGNGAPTGTGGSAAPSGAASGTGSTSASGSASGPDAGKGAAGNGAGASEPVVDGNCTIVVPSGSSSAPTSSTSSTSGSGAPGTTSTTPTTSTTALPVGEPTLGAFAPLRSPLTAHRAVCVASPVQFRVRAGQQDQLAVRVHENGVALRRAKVRITGPGVRQTKFTGARGVALFTFEPTHAGRLYVQSDACFGANRIAVLAAKRTVAATAPSYTG